MPVIAYQCKSCGAELSYQPDKGAFVCEYCGSSYTKEELEFTEKATSDADVQQENTPPPQGEDASDQALLYYCPNCGGEVITDATTAATQCYYCHSPIVLSGRLSGEFLPKYIIPFQFNRESALDKFYAWTKSKWFLPKDFFSEKQVETLTGIYFPYWIIDCDSHVHYSAECEHTESWVIGDFRYTRHRIYHCIREGTIHLEDLIKSALTKASKRLIENVQPFDESSMEPFSMTYLSGFQAEKRDISENDIRDEVLKDIDFYSKKSIETTISGYGSQKETAYHCAPTEVHWDYGLLPVWAMTYHYKGQIYYFALNGQSGKICGKLPVNIPKLLAVATVVSGLALTLGLLGGYFL